MIDAYGRWFPDYPGQQIYQDPQYIAKLNQQQNMPQAQQNGQGQSMTPPTIRADIIQIGVPEEVDRYQQQSGTSQMFITRDESCIIIREQGQSGYSLTHYDRRQPEPVARAMDPSMYVTWDKLEERLASFAPPRPARSTAAKEEK